MLHSLGIATAKAILAAAMFQVGGIVGGLGSGPFVNRFGTEKVVAAMLAMGGGWLVLLSLTNVPTLALAGFIFGAGLGISTGQLGVNALPGAIYPPAIRNTGAGWALGVGRLGNIVGPLLGGILLSLGWTPKHMLLAISAPAFLLAVMLLILANARASAQSASAAAPGVPAPHFTSPRG
jgi:AAHS family 4-hydroxybenzoate transporter-like MFS transporter